MSGRIARPGGQLVAEAGADPLITPGVRDLYGAVLVEASAFARRRRLELIVEIALIGLYFALRTIGANEPTLDVWLVVVAVVALASPTSGLVILAAIAPFNEGISITRDIGSKTVLAVALLIGVTARVGMRWAADRTARRRPTRAMLPVILAGALIVGTGLGLIRSWDRWGKDFAEQAGEIWLQGVATMLIVFIVTVWVARHGQLRPLIVAIVATTAAGLISLLDFGGDAAMRDSDFGWLVVGQFSPDRLTGVIRSPTATAALVMVPLTVFVVAVIQARDVRLRIVAAILAVPLLVAAYLTYNRAVFLGLYVLLVVVGWRIRRWLGVGLLVGGLVLGALLLPRYLELRGGVGGAGGLPPPKVIFQRPTKDLQYLETMAVGPDGRLYMGSSDAGDAGAIGTALSGRVLAINRDGSGLEQVAKGLRQPFGIAFVQGDPSPVVGNESDEGKSNPPDFIVHADKGSDFGFPKCQWASPSASVCAGKTPPVVRLRPHASPTGLVGRGSTIYAAFFGGTTKQGPEIRAYTAQGQVSKQLVRSALPLIGVGLNGSWLYFGDVSGSIYRVRV